jgi:parallel beta-helix repeat protein
MKHLLLLTACVFLTAGQSLALNCGDTISGNVTLTADLVCNSKTALIVSASNTTINLNGHTLSCLGAGVAGTCQATSINGQHSISGIKSENYSNVKVLGPGTITGFERGIQLTGGNKFVVQGVKVTGPILSLEENNRSVAIGIGIMKAPCPISFLGEDTTPSALVADNEVTAQAWGIRIDESSCAEVRSNIVHDINRADGNAYGILLWKSTNTKVYRNSVFSVGLNRGQDSGIMLYTNANWNNVFSNVSNSNCGNGIYLLDSVKNKINDNTARHNGINSQGGRCGEPQSFVYDLKSTAPAPDNTWNFNNVCRKQNNGVTAGVCNPNE